jgi:uncharacterized protein
MRRLLLLLLLGVGLSAGFSARAAETIPPPPLQYVTDTTGAIPTPLVAQLNQRLADYERQTSNQIVAVVSRSLPAGTTLEEYAQSLYHAWKIGSKKNSNGVLILMFINDKKAWIQTGYGLEGALPDVLCNRIVREQMSPAFRSGNYGGALAASISAVMLATKGEYKGAGQTGKHPATFKDFLFSPLGFFLFVFVLLMIVSRSRRDLGPGGVNPGAAAATGFLIGGLGGWGGGSGGGDSGGFSGGGGDSGGGGGGGDL